MTIPHPAGCPWKAGADGPRRVRPGLNRLVFCSPSAGIVHSDGMSFLDRAREERLGRLTGEDGPSRLRESIQERAAVGH